MNWQDRLNQTRRNPKYIRIARILGSFVTAIAILLAIQQESRKIVIGDWMSIFTVWVIGIGIYSIAFWFQALSWCSLVGGLGKFQFGWKDFEIYAISNIAKRTPGAVWYLLERVERYRERGTKAEITLTASSIEWLLLMISGALIYFFVSSSWIGLPLGIVATPVFVLLSYIVAKRRKSYGISHSDSRLDRTNRIFSASPEILFTLFIDGLCHAFCAIIIYQLVQNSGTAINFSISDGIRAWTSTAVIGILASLVIPVTLGVRELTISTVLLPFIPLGSTIIVAAELRLIILIADVVCSFILWRLARWSVARQASQTRLDSPEITG